MYDKYHYSNTSPTKLGTEAVHMPALTPSSSWVVSSNDVPLFLGKKTNKMVFSVIKTASRCGFLPCLHSLL